MSTVKEQVLAAIADGSRTSAEVQEATGLDANNVHQACFALKKAGTIIKGEGGYELAEGVVATAPAADPPPSQPKAHKVRQAEKKRVAKKRPRPAAPAANGHAGNGVGVEFARFGDFVVLKKADVVELLRTMQRWQQMVEGMLA